jgi:endonuclease YncB( thermonuclease family)
VDGIDLHRWLVGNGWALNFEPYARGRFKDDEQEARERGAGMWRGCDGPMFEQGLKALAGRKLRHPKRDADRPDRDRLALRFASFRG